MSLKYRILCSAICVLAILDIARAQVLVLPIHIYNTGVDNSGSILVSGTDLHYSLVGGSALITTSVPGSWLSPGGTSQWLTPTGNGNESHVAGFYTWQTNFDLSGLNSTTAILSGRFASDNIGRILLNGVDQGVSNPGVEFLSYTNFSLTNGFVPGVNTLSFVVENPNVAVFPNPTGLRAEVSGTASALSAPEPGTFALLALGGTLAMVYRRRRGDEK